MEMRRGMWREAKRGLGKRSFDLALKDGVGLSRSIGTA
jgi:hypothetical protein